MITKTSIFLKYSHICITILTVVSLFCLFIPPYKIWPAGFMAYLLPLFLLYQVLASLVLILKRKIIAFVSIVILFISYPIFRSGYGFSNQSLSADCKVLSFNANCFNSPGKVDTKDREVFNRMISNTTSQRANVISFQEYCGYHAFPAFNVKAKLKENYPYLAHPYSMEELKNYPNELSIYSQYPIINVGRVKTLQEKLIAIYADILTPVDTIRIYNTHLYSLSLSRTDFWNFSWFSKIKKGLEITSAQTEVLLDHIGNSPYKMIVTGDFNSLPNSYVYHTLRNKLNNGFEEKGSGFGYTYDHHLRFLRIDYQFSHRKLKVASFKRIGKKPLSDHFPIMVGYSLNP